MVVLSYVDRKIFRSALVDWLTRFGVVEFGSL